MCGKLNENSWQVCQSCNASLKPGISGWVCQFYTFINKNKNDYECFKIQKRIKVLLKIIENVQNANHLI